MRKIFETKSVGGVRSSVELQNDGMVVRFPFHPPRKLFCDPETFLPAVERGEPEIKGEGFVIHILKRTVKLILKTPLYGHRLMILSLQKFVNAAETFHY
ncbi:MAG: hypothetical protein ACD_61C00038G0004 [uncultured bacterium]|nr:MAG: hypothetical protein ACD_61C00038G0004 [uncultured bacterium]